MNIVHMYELEASEREIELIYERANSNQVPLMSIDSHRITQVFVNLNTNALTDTVSKGKVLVAFEPLEQELQIHVKDSGHGIAEEHIPYIFNRFYRADKDRSREHGGMGLGLAIAKEYVEAHQGFVTVKSEVGEGTTFTVHLKYS
jgi:signal transduction histidine kinase